MSHHTSGNINSFNPTNSFTNVWNNCTVVDEKFEILPWLFPPESQRRHHDIPTDTIDEVGSWLLLQNIGIGLVVSAVVNLMVQPRFAIEVLKLARPILCK